MANTVAAVNSLADSAVTAIGTGDYKGALTYLEQAAVRIALIPDSEKDQASLTFDRESLNALIKQVQGRAASAAGLQFTKLCPQGPAPCDCCDD